MLDSTEPDAIHGAFIRFGAELLKKFPVAPMPTTQQLFP